MLCLGLGPAQAQAPPPEQKAEGEQIPEMQIEGMSAEQADTIFDPSFKVAEGRVSSGNWSLFNARQIVYEHGGDIRLETATGEGTALHITLPVV